MSPPVRLSTVSVKFASLLVAALLLNGIALRPPAAFAASASVTATGRVVYTDDNSRTVPVSHAKVTLYDYDCPLDEVIPIELCRHEMASGTTREDGTFTLSGGAEDLDLCIGQVVGSWCCNGLYVSTCVGMTYGDNMCCPGIYEENACDIGDIYSESAGKCCNGIYNPITVACETVLGGRGWYASEERCDSLVQPYQAEMVCTVPWVPAVDTPDPYIQVEATSAAGSVQTELLIAGAWTYCLRTERRENQPDGAEIDFGDISPDNALPCCAPCADTIDVSSEDAAWHLHNALYDVYDFMRPIVASNPGGTIPPVPLLWPAELSELGESSFYDGGAIHIHRDSQWEDTTAYHEYGHHILGTFADSPTPFYWNEICDHYPFASHCAWRPEDGCVWPTPRGECVNTAHFTEGFPNFLARAVAAKEKKTLDYDWEVPMLADIASGTACPWNPPMHCPVAGEDPQSMEGVTTAILWDLYDHRGLSPVQIGTTEELLGVWGSSATDVVALGTNAVWRYQGISWARVPGSDTPWFTGSWAASAKDIFVVGTSGRIYRYDGTGWTAMASGTTESLNAVWGSSATDVFAVGNGGVIVHFDGTDWTTMANPSTRPLNAVWGSSATDVFAVGSGGTVVHFDGASWVTMAGPSGFELNGVWGSAWNDVFAVGVHFTPDGLKGWILHYDGSVWSSFPDPGDVWLNAVWGSSGNDVFAVGRDGVVLHYDGNVWSSLTHDFRISANLNAAWGSAAGDVYFAGDGGTLLHYGQDNHDTNGSTDRLSVTFSEIWNTIIDHDPDPLNNIPVINVLAAVPVLLTEPVFIDHPVTIAQFFDAFTDSHPMLINRLAEIFHENHIPTGIGANLVVDAFSSSLAGSPAAVLAGESFTVTDTTANSGAATPEIYGNSWAFSSGLTSATRYYLHVADTLPWEPTQSGTAVMIGYRNVDPLTCGYPLNANSSSSATTTVTVPYGIAAGTYWLHACTDATGRVFEVDESDNCRVAGQVAVSYPDTDGDGQSDDTDSDDDGDGAPDAGDCRPLDASVHPGATDVCDGADNDCDSRVDEDALKLPWYPDADGDGYGGAGTPAWACSAPAGYVAWGGDCDDGRAAINPAAAETCNGYDDNCDDLTDNGPAEQCNNQDDDCDTLIDEDFQADADGIADCFDNCALESNRDQADGDGDGSGDVCDVCPALTGTGCDTNRSAGLSIGSGGGTFATPDGSVTITVPPGALGTETSLSITGTAGSFGLGTAGGDATAYYGVTILPAGQTFSVPIAIVFSWPDSQPPPGKIDGTNIDEDDLVIYKDGVALTDACEASPDCDRDANTFTVRVTSLSAFALAVPNGPPIVGAIAGPIEPRQIGTSVAVSASFTDPGFLDTHTATWSWGDGTSSAGTLTEAGGAGSVTDTHAYATPGIYAVTLTVTDSHGLSGTAEFRSVVVYDPNGGFVTGGGWITSPPGALLREPALSGKATFGFVSQYRKGTSIPSGSAQFQFDTAGLSFHSNQQEWLVVAGARAQFKGVGTINGTGSYGFMLTAIDGQVSGGGGIDKFRMKIWEKATGVLVYDNQGGASDTAALMTALGGGSITVHAAK